MSQSYIRELSGGPRAQPALPATEARSKLDLQLALAVTSVGFTALGRHASRDESTCRAWFHDRKKSPPLRIVYDVPPDTAVEWGTKWARSLPREYQRDLALRILRDVNDEREAG